MSLYLQSLFFTLQITAPIFCLVFLGALFKRYKLIDDAFVTTASRLVFIVSLPVLVFMSIAQTKFQTVINLKQLLFFFFGTLIAFLLLWLAARSYIKCPEDQAVFIQGSFRSNFGILGMAISYNLFANAGLAQGAMLLALVIPVFNILSIIALSIPAKKTGKLGIYYMLLEVGKNPLIIAVVAALPFSYFNLGLPNFIQRTGDYFSNITLPLALLTIGASLNIASLRSSSLQAAWASFNKLILIPIIATPIAWLCGFRAQELAMLMIVFACPTAAASFVMAKAMHCNAELAANIILITTLGSVITLSSGIYMLRILNII